MELHYLDFDSSDEESGRGSFDAMASVVPDRVPLLLGEVTGVLSWAAAAFGPPGGLEEDAGAWDAQVQAVWEPGDRPVAVWWDTASGVVSVPALTGAGRLVLTLTVAGSPAFCAALREAFGLER